MIVVYCCIVIVCESCNFLSEGFDENVQQITKCTKKPQQQAEAKTNILKEIQLNSEGYKQLAAKSWNTFLYMKCTTFYKRFSGKYSVCFKCWTAEKRPRRPQEVQSSHIPLSCPRRSLYQDALGLRQLMDETLAFRENLWFIQSPIIEILCKSLPTLNMRWAQRQPQVTDGWKWSLFPPACFDFEKVALAVSRPVPLHQSGSSTRFCTRTHPVDLAHAPLMHEGREEGKVRTAPLLLVQGSDAGFPWRREAILTGADAQIYKDELKMNRSQAETQHANPISWPWLSASPLGIPTIYRHMFHRPNRALLCCTDILCMHLRCEPPPPRCLRQMAAGSEVIAGRIESDLTPVWLTWFAHQWIMGVFAQAPKSSLDLATRVFAEGKRPALADGLLWLAVTGQLFDEWNDSEPFPPAANVFGLVGTSWLLIRLFTHQKGAKRVSISVAGVSQRPDWPA